MKKILFSLVAITVMLIMVALVAPSFHASAQTNTGVFRINSNNFATVGNTLILEATPGGGGNVGLLSDGSNTVKLTQNDGVTKLGSLSAVQACGTAQACSLTQPSALKEVFGSCTAAATTTCTVTALPFTSPSSYFCFGQDTTTAANNAFKLANVSASSFTITATSSSDVFNYDCKGT